MNFFRYDYNYKLLIISNIPSVLFLVLTIATYRINNIAFYLGIFTLIFSILNTYLYINNQGIRVLKNKIIIVDELYFRTINLSEIKYVKLKELKKEKNTNIYGFSHEFYHSSTYMTYCDYVYNNGKVFEITFYLKDGTAEESYFGWMYREKNKETVSKIHSKLIDFVDSINETVKNGH